MARFKASKNHGGITHGGESYKPKKGLVDLPDDFPLDLAASHGLVPADADELGKQEPQDPPEDPPKGEGE